MEIPLSSPASTPTPKIYLILWEGKNFGALKYLFLNVFIVMKINVLGQSVVNVPSLENLLLLVVCKGNLPTRFAGHVQATKRCFLAG